MNYEDMHFTEEDKKQLQRNKQAMMKWIEENIVPYLSPSDSYDRILVEFGGIYRCHGDFSKGVSNYRIVVYGSEQTFYSGGGTHSKGKIGYGEKYGGIGHSLDEIWSPYQIYPLMDNWEYIKGELLAGLRNRRAASKAIAEFAV